MKSIRYILRTVLLMVMALALNAEPVLAAADPAPAQMTAAQKKKAAALKKKEAAKKKKEKEKAKAAKKKAKAAAKKEKAKAKKESHKMTPEEKRIYNQDLHFVSMWGGVGYSGLVNGYETPAEGAAGSVLGSQLGFKHNFIGGGGGKIGVGYELHHRAFMMSVGPELRIFSSQDNMKFANPFDFAQPDYASMVQHYQFARLHETATVGQIMLPIMFGMNNIADRFYFLAGAKIGYTFVGAYRQTGRLTTSVTENMAVEDWSDVPSHFLITDAKLKDHPLYSGTGKGMNKFGLDATLSAEFGVNLNEFFPAEWQESNAESRHPWHMRVAVFMDYGLKNLNASKMLPFLETETVAMDGSYWADPTAVKTNSIHQTDWAAGHFVSSLLVGVKFTALLQLNKPKVPNPRIQMFVQDAFTDKALAGAKVTVSTPDNPRKRPQVKTMKKDGGFQQRFPKGNYDMVASANGYLESDTIHYEHTEDLRDTVRFRLIPTPMFTAFVHDAKTEVLIPATLKFVSRETGEDYEIMAMGDQGGKISLPYGQHFDLSIEADGYHGATASVNDLYATEHYQLNPIVRIRRTLILKHMYFATDKTDILPESESDLMKLYNFLTENPAIRVLITGHTDSQGSDTYNQKLSEGRSASVKAEMVKRGIAADRIETDGKGESMPIDTNDTEEGRQNNRRVEVTVLNADEAVEDVY